MLLPTATLLLIAAATLPASVGVPVGAPDAEAAATTVVRDSDDVAIDADLRTADASDDAAPRQRGRRGEPRGDLWRRPLAPEQIEQVIGVAGEVVPEWGERLRALQNSDPEALDRALASSGRRLMSLAALRQRSPELYALKVAELRNQMELRRLGGVLRQALAEGRSDDAAATRAEIRRLAERQVDFGLRTRAEELAAMDAALLRMRLELAEEAKRRQQSIDDLVEAIESGRGAERVDGVSGPVAIGAGVDAPRAPRSAADR
jgi:hypothetical protein